MKGKIYKHIIVGAGLTGVSAAEGIREIDKEGSILLIGRERHMPYDRPPLTKKLWTGAKKVEDIFVHKWNFYDSHAVELDLNTTVLSIDVSDKSVADDKGNRYFYAKLLLATGGAPKTLPIPGGNIRGICYYRYLDDYLRIRAEAKEGKSAVVIGGGFIGSEISAALSMNRVDVTMIFPEPYLCSRVFPESLGRSVQRRFTARGVKILSGDAPALIEKHEERFVTTTGKGEKLKSDMLIAGIGIMPAVSLAENAGLRTENGIVVNRYLQTSNPDIYAAGDNAMFEYLALGRRMRIEHWDNAINQGKWAGRNMAGAGAPFTYMPYFYSDLFEFGYEAVGDINSALETVTEWQKENDTGVIYYVRDEKIVGMMMCNLYGRLDEARRIIKKGERAEAVLGVPR